MYKKLAWFAAGILILSLPLVLGSCSTSFIPASGVPQELQPTYHNGPLTSVVVLETTGNQEELQAQWVWVAIGYFLLAATVIEAIYECAIPVYNDLNAKGITDKTARACLEQIAFYAIGAGAGTVIKETAKVTVIRQAIKDNLGSVFTWKQLQQMFNQQNKPAFAKVFGDLVSRFFQATWNAIKTVFDKYGVPYTEPVAPAIQSITIQGQTLKVGIKYTGTVYFSDPDGDVTGIQFDEWTDLISGGWKMVAGWSTQNLLRVDKGRFNFYITCNSTGSKKGRVTLTDIGGRSSSKVYNYSCTK